MGVSIGFGVGPVRVSKRIGGSRRRGAPSPSIDRERARATRRAKLLAMDERQFRHHVIAQWVAVAAFAIWMLASAWPLAILAVPLGLLVHHFQLEQRKDRARAARDALPPIDPQREARRARELGLPDGVWEDATPTGPIRPAGRHAR